MRAHQVLLGAEGPSLLLAMSGALAMQVGRGDRASTPRATR